MTRPLHRGRRTFLQTLAAGVPAAAGSLPAASVLRAETPPVPARHGAGRGGTIPLERVIAGSDCLPFRRLTLDLGVAEAVAVADMNGDGRLDIVSGEHWYEQLVPGPEGLRFRKHKFRSLPYFNFYLSDLTDHVLDVNGDGLSDVVSSSWWYPQLSWWENPGRAGRPWRMHIIESRASVEFAFLVDILNTGQRRQLLPQFGNRNVPLAWYEPAGKGEKPGWIRHVISPRSYGHGIGAGDVNGDGRTDILTPLGWLEAPPDPRRGPWPFHAEFDLGEVGFIYVHDVNGDGLPDLVCSAAHGYGLFWWEQRKNAAGRRIWVKHLIDDAWSQAHALTLVDLNSDGRLELVTGKRYYAHQSDPGANEPLGVYWYEQLDAAGTRWRRHLIDYSSRAGGGMQIPVVDLNGDGRLDVIVAGKSGLFVFENLSA